MASYRDSRYEPETGRTPSDDPPSMEEAAEPSAGAAPMDGASASTNGGAVEAVFARQAGTVFGLLRAAVEEAAAAAETRNAALAAGIRELQLRALHSIEDSAYATIELLEALGAARTPGELTRRQIGLARRHGEAAGETLA